MQDRCLAYRIASATYFEKNTDVHMKMDMCMCVLGLPGHQQKSSYATGRVYITRMVWWRVCYQGGLVKFMLPKWPDKSI